MYTWAHKPIHITLGAYARRNTSQGLEVLLVQVIEGDLICCPMGRGVDPVAPLQELAVHIVKGGEGSAKEEVAFNVANGVFDLSFGLGTVGFAEPGNEPIL